MSSATKTDPDLWEKVKEELIESDKGGEPGQWFARKAKLAVREYKSAVAATRMMVQIRKTPTRTGAERGSSFRWKTRRKASFTTWRRTARSKADQI